MIWKRLRVSFKAFCQVLLPGIPQGIPQGSGTRMPPSTDLLCDQCANINFKFFAKEKQDEDYETLSNISWAYFSPEDCQICQLLEHCIKNSGDKISLREHLRGVYTGHELQLYIDGEKTSRRLDYSIRSCEPAPSSHNKGYQISTSFDVNELKRWLNQCDTVHQCLPHNESQKPLPADFRLIDVKKYRIVRPKSHVKYCALSYVWGNKEQPSLKLSNLKKYESKWRRFLENKDLPRTIVDAMALCRDIGCRYLWVDSLCVIQDSKKNKYTQINSMAEIYSQSFLAFIATVGDDSDAGLAPYRKRNLNISYLLCRSSKISLVASLSPQIAAQQIVKSAWATRGWTLQEYALSRRVLFLTGSYAFLRCENELRFEDFGLDFSNSFGNDRRWDLPLPPFYRRTPSHNRHYPSVFSQILAQFVRRRFSFESDILDAFTGILTRMEGEEDRSDGIGVHIWGLPSREFGAALQWITNAPWPSKERTGFPSYSWAGWFHTKDSILPVKGFHDMYEGFDNQVTNMSVLTWYKYHEDKSIQMFGKCYFESQLSKVKRKNNCSDDAEEISRIETKLQRYFTPQPYEELATFVKQTTFLKPPLSHHVFFWANCASLYVDRISAGAGHQAIWNFPLRIKKGGSQIGSIRLDPEWRKAEPDKMDFFVSTAGVYLSSVPAELAPHSLQLKFKVILTKPYCVMKVPTYKRIQVSHTPISSKDWALAHPKINLIALV